MRYRYWLMHLEGVGNRGKRMLIDSFDSACTIYEAAISGASCPEEVQEKTWDEVKKQCDAARMAEDYERFLSTGLAIVTLEDEEYPKYLRDVYDAPYGLYVRGNLPRAIDKSVAIVGARRCSAYGKKMAEDLATCLGEAGYTIVSGMARGVDSYAHLGCLRTTSPTIAVLGCGVDVCYPPENQRLYQEIMRHGAILSEYEPGSQPIAQQFPARNRIISGIAHYVIVVEAKHKSGSLITADFALEQGRDVYAVPGRTTDAMSRGCNQLIAQGAGIITSPEDFLAQIEESNFTELSVGRSSSPEELLLAKEEHLVYSSFDFYPKSIDAVQTETGIALLSLLSIIMNLCDRGLLRECFKNQYIRTS